MPAPDNDPTVTRYQYSGFSDPTGAPSPVGNERMHRGYTPLTTDVPGQHVHNTVGDPAGDPLADPVVPAQKDVIEGNDLWIDTTPAE